MRKLHAVIVATALSLGGIAAAEPVTVRYPEGTVRGFLVLRGLDDKILAEGEAIQTATGDRVTAKLVFRFRDGSLQEESTVYSQRDRFKLISGRLVQKGPTFPQPLEMTIDGNTGNVNVSYQEKGQQKTATERMTVPDDLANGMVSKLLMNARPDAMPASFSLIAATPTPRMVKLMVMPAGRGQFSIGGAARQANHYVLKVEIGGVAGVIAPLIGKQPPDSHVWILGGDVPAFVRSEQPLYAGGPMVRIELTSPVWPKTQTPPTAKADTTKRKAPG